MVAQKFTASRTELHIPDDMPTKGKGSGIATAFVKGARAAGRGTSRSRCPYSHERGAAKFRSAWLRGFDTWHQATERSRDRKASA